MLENELVSKGEIVGPPSSARLCVVMPVRSSNLARALRNVETWSLARAAPCVPGHSTADHGGRHEHGADLALFHAQSFETAADARLASALSRALKVSAVGGGVGESSWPPWRCFGAVRFLAARIPLEQDVYTIYPTHNFTGPNLHFLHTFDALGKLARARVARCERTPGALGGRSISTRACRCHRYTHFQLLETDVFAIRPGWVDALVSLSRRRGKEWVRGSLSMCLRPTEVEHVNGALAAPQRGPGPVASARRGYCLAATPARGRMGGRSSADRPPRPPATAGNALYSLESGFVSAVRRELGKRLDSWAFDVLLGHWLRRAHRGRIARSAHVLSISTFQRNRTCCELVRRIVEAPEDVRSARSWEPPRPC